jgi:putative spermidine/putrescine transport system substrate-binding protein
VVPPDDAVAGYYFQAINKEAPQPAAARLWQEFLFSDEGQNMFMAGGVHPVRADQMAAAGTADKAAFAELPVIDGQVVIPTAAQTETAYKYLADNWAKAIG